MMHRTMALANREPVGSRYSGRDVALRGARSFSERQPLGKPRSNRRRHRAAGTVSILGIKARARKPRHARGLDKKVDAFRAFRMATFDQHRLCAEREKAFALLAHRVFVGGNGGV